MEKCAMPYPTPMFRALQAIERAGLTSTLFTCSDAYEGPFEPADLDLYHALDIAERAMVIRRAEDYAPDNHDTMRYVPGPCWSSMEALLDACRTDGGPFAEEERVASRLGPDLDRVAWVISRAELVERDPLLARQRGLIAAMADIPADASRCYLLDWLAANDRNGCYTDADTIAEAYDLDDDACLTIDQAWALVAYVCDPDDGLCNAMWPGMF